MLNVCILQVPRPVAAVLLPVLPDPLLAHFVEPVPVVKRRCFKGTVSRDFLIRFMTLKTKSVLFVQALIV